MKLLMCLALMVVGAVASGAPGYGAGYGDGFKHTAGSVSTAYRNADRQRTVNAIAEKVGASSGTAKYYDVPGAGQVYGHNYGQYDTQRHGGYGGNGGYAAGHGNNGYGAKGYTATKEYSTKEYSTKGHAGAGYGSGNAANGAGYASHGAGYEANAYGNKGYEGKENVKGYVKKEYSTKEYSAKGHDGAGYAGTGYGAGAGYGAGEGYAGNTRFGAGYPYKYNGFPYNYNGYPYNYNGNNYPAGY